MLFKSLETSLTGVTFHELKVLSLPVFWHFPLSVLFTDSVSFPGRQTATFCHVPLRLMQKQKGPFTVCMSSPPDFKLSPCESIHSSRSWSDQLLHPT